MVRRSPGIGGESRKGTGLYVIHRNVDNRSEIYTLKLNCTFVLKGNSAMNPVDVFREEFRSGLSSLIDHIPGLQIKELRGEITPQLARLEPELARIYAELLKGDINLEIFVSLSERAIYESYLNVANLRARYGYKESEPFRRFLEERLLALVQRSVDRRTQEMWDNLDPDIGDEKRNKVVWDEPQSDEGDGDTDWGGARINKGDDDTDWGGARIKEEDDPQTDEEEDDTDWGGARIREEGGHTYRSGIRINEDDDPETDEENGDTDWGGARIHKNEKGKGD